ncbi:MAG: response regulator transcription factor [Planctomycetaceae bacterium]|nr:response regulator transcription factor [Planctomycetaceae bacterium]
MKTNLTSVVLADDHAMVRESLARVLESSGSVTVIGQASDGLQLLEVVEAECPNCVVLDYSMPKMDAPHAIEKLVVRHPELKILVLTVHENVHYAVRAVEAGAHGYMIKSAAVDELVDAIQVVSNGGIYISPKVAREVWLQLRRPKRERLGLESLSQREFDVLRLLGTGISLQECAVEMKVSTSTVSTYRSRILEKLNLSSTAELIRFSLENKISG